MMLYVAAETGIVERVFSEFVLLLCYVTDRGLALEVVETHK